MAREQGDGQSRPKWPFPVTGGRPESQAAPRWDRVSETYSGTSLCRPSPPRDPVRDPHLSLAGSSADLRRQETARRQAEDEAREASLQRDLEARHGGGSCAQEGSSTCGD